MNDSTFEQSFEQSFEQVVLQRIEQAELAEHDGALTVRIGSRRLRFPGLSRDDLETLLDLVDGHRTVAEVIDAASEFDPAEARRVLWELSGLVVEPRLGVAEKQLGSAIVVDQLGLGPPRRSRDSQVRSVGVLGAGTAGLLAALGLRRKLPEVEVTVVASSQLPVIGVGEATTPLMPAFLHGTLGLDPQELFERVRPVWKLGVQFDWGRPGTGHFNYPFQRGPLLEAWQYEGDLNCYSPASLLMEAGRSPLLSAGAGHFELLPTPFAYHLDNRPFVEYLQAMARRAGVRFVDRRIAEVQLDAAGESVEKVVADTGEELAFDLWIDASGFASRLLGGALEEPFDDWSSSLPTDAAWVGAAKRQAGQAVNAHTVASTLQHGWQWRISLAEEDHLGYVFASTMIDTDSAANELRARSPGLDELRLLRFRSGRRRNAWRGNVFALGNAYGFVEPLESTALHMVLVAVTTLIRHFPRRLDEPTGRRLVNRYLGDFWDDLRWFLALHFRFNRRLDTPFWRHCREKVEIGAAAEAVELYRESAPLSYRPHLLSFDSLWGDFGRDVLLLGQGIEGGWLKPRLSKTEWRRRLSAARDLTEYALPMNEALAVLDRRPDLLRRWAWQTQWVQDASVGGTVGW